MSSWKRKVEEYVRAGKDIRAGDLGKVGEARICQMSLILWGCLNFAGPELWSVWMCIWGIRYVLEMDPSRRVMECGYGTAERNACCTCRQSARWRWRTLPSFHPIFTGVVTYKIISLYHQKT